ncbi:hypothetical protein H4V99_002630 [Cryobacterium sp. CG_9.6]|nr:hypothetical protein [Cryobacterium sp. CG_9.6]
MLFARVSRPRNRVSGSSRGVSTARALALDQRRGVATVSLVEERACFSRASRRFYGSCQAVEVFFDDVS